MRLSMVTSLLTCLFAVGASGAMTARVEASEAGSAYERYELPDSDIAIAVPPEWTVDLERLASEFEMPDGDGATSTVVMQTLVRTGTESPGPRGCFVYLFDDLMLKLMTYEHAALYASGYGAIEGATADIRGVDLPVGWAARVDIHDPSAALYWSYYLFDIGLDRYELACFDEEPSDDAWRHIADTIESTRDVPVEELPPAQRVELEEAGVAITYPPGWEVEMESEVREYQLPLEYMDQDSLELRTVPYQDLVRGRHPDFGLRSCALSVFEEMPMSLARQAEETARRFSWEEDPQITTIPVDLSVGDAVRVDFESGDQPRAQYVFDANGRRFTLDCGALLRADDDWLAIADSIETLDEGPTDEAPTDEAPTGRRVEIPAAAAALSYPSDWTIEREDEVAELKLPADYAWAAPLMKRQHLRASSGSLAGCLVYAYDAAIPLDELVDLQVSRLDAPDEGWTAAAETVRLPAGDAFRLDVVNEADGVYYTSYFVEASGSHLELLCLDEARADDDWLSLANSIEVSAGSPPAGTVVSEHSVSDFGSLVLVAEGDSLDGSVMRADCTSAVWLTYEDGTYEEQVQCTLSDDPVDPPEWQGARPAQTVTISGGACEWTSDFWFQTDGSDVWASAYEFTITPDGQVTGRMSYGSELLDCSEG